LGEANGNIQPYLFKKANELAEMSLAI